jgi:lipase chaperone LimK
MKYLGISIIVLVVSAGVYFSSQTTINVVTHDVYEDNYLHIKSPLSEPLALQVAPANDSLPKQLAASSLKGTEIDGAYPLDSDGNLVMALAIKKRFDYFLSTIGEYSLDEILRFIEQDMENNLTEPALSQARHLLKQYLDFKKGLMVLEQQMDVAQDYEIQDLAQFRMKLDQLKEVRREYLPPDAVNAFFEFDEVYDEFMLQQLEIQNNQQLTEQEKQQQLQSIIDDLPEDIRLVRAETQKISDTYLHVEKLRQQGASEEEIQSVRQQVYGIEATERLQVLDESRANWKSRVDNYLTELSHITQSDLSDEEKQQALNELKQEGFSEQEQARLRAYELMASESN